MRLSPIAPGNRSILACILRAAEFADRDHSSNIITGVHLHRHGDHIRCVATDGKGLACIHAWGGGIDLPQPITLTADSVRRVADLAVSPTAGACKDCAKRSSCEGRLFEDANQTGDRCLDAVCWAEKLAAHTCRRAAELGEKHARVAVLVNKHGAHATPAPSGLPEAAVQVDASMVETCKKKDEGAIAAVDVETGTTLWVRPKSWADKETRKALGATATATVAADGSPDPSTETAGPTAAQKREAKRAAWRVDQAEIALSDAEPPPSLEETVALYLALRVQRKSPLEPSTWTEVADLSKMTKADLAQELWNDITGNLNGLARGIRPGSVPPTDAIESLETMATLLPKEQEAKALEEIPEPKGKKA